VEDCEDNHCVSTQAEVDDKRESICANATDADCNFGKSKRRCTSPNYGAVDFILKLRAESVASVLVPTLGRGVFEKSLPPK